MPPSLVVSVHLCPGGDVVVQHQQMQLFLALLVVDGGDQHPAGLILSIKIFKKGVNCLKGMEFI